MRGTCSKFPPAPSWVLNKGQDGTRGALGENQGLAPCFKRSGDLATPASVGVSDAGMQKDGLAKARHLNVANCVSTAVVHSMTTARARLERGWARSVNSHFSVLELSMSVDEQGEASKLLFKECLERISGILKSFALVFVSRRSLRGADLFTNKEFGRFVGSLRQTAEVLASYSLANQVKSGVKYHLDVILAKAFHDSQPVPVPSFLEGTENPNLFRGWLGVAVKRALHRRDQSFIYSLTKGAPQSWPSANFGEVMVAFEKHRRLLGTPKPPPPRDILEKIVTVMKQYFPEATPESSTTYFTPDEGEMYLEDPRMLTLESSASKFMPTQRACRQLGRGEGGGLMLVPPLVGLAKDFDLRSLQHALVDWRERAYLASTIQFEQGVSIQERVLKESSQDRVDIEISQLRNSISSGLLRKKNGKSIVPKELKDALESEKVEVTSKVTYHPPSCQSFSWLQPSYRGLPRSERQTYRLNDVTAVGLCEAGFKVRIITKGDGPTSALLQPVQGWLLSCWKKTPWHTMKPSDSDLTERIQGIADSWQELLKKEENPEFDSEEEEDPWNRRESFTRFFGKGGSDEPCWMSGDFEAATDQLKKEITLTAASQVGGSYGDLLLLSFAPARVKYSFPLIPKKVLPPPVNQYSGQLMGHPCSFPLLCVANISTFLVALDRWIVDAWNSGDEAVHRHRMRFMGWVRGNVVVNGDDILAFIPPSLYRIWKVVTTEAGLVPSKGKNFFSSDTLQINSQVFRVNAGTVRRVWYLNQRLVTGMSVKNGDTIASPVDTAREFNKVMGGIPWAASCLPMVFSRWPVKTWSPIINGIPVTPNWFLPAHLGGWGADPRFGPDDVRVTPGQRRLAAMFVSKTDSQPAMALYKVLTGTKSIEACRLAERLSLVRFRFGDYVPTEHEELISSADAGWFGRLTYFSRARATNIPMGDVALSRKFFPKNYHAVPMSLEGIAAYWTLQIFTNTALPPVPPFLPPVGLGDRKVQMRDGILDFLDDLRLDNLGQSNTRVGFDHETHHGIDSDSSSGDMEITPHRLRPFPVDLPGQIGKVSELTLLEAVKMQSRASNLPLRW